MLNATQAYRFGFECGHLTGSEAQAELDKAGVLDQDAYDSFWSGFGAFQDDEYEDEYGDYDDGQPSEYDEWQDYMGGDDWDHGQYDCCEEY